MGQTEYWEPAARCDTLLRSLTCPHINIPSTAPQKVLAPPCLACPVARQVWSGLVWTAKPLCLDRNYMFSSHLHSSRPPESVSWLHFCLTCTTVSIYFMARRRCCDLNFISNALRRVPAGTPQTVLRLLRQKYLEIPNQAVKRTAG